MESLRERSMRRLVGQSIVEDLPFPLDIELETRKQIGKLAFYIEDLMIRTLDEDLIYEADIAELMLPIYSTLKVKPFSPNDSPINVKIFDLAREIYSILKDIFQKMPSQERDIFYVFNGYLRDEMSQPNNFHIYDEIEKIGDKYAKLFHTGDIYDYVDTYRNGVSVQLPLKYFFIPIIYNSEVKMNIIYQLLNIGYYFFLREMS